jgi:dTMP kinase
LAERGVFIAFDGTEGAGKSTQVRMLADRLRAMGQPPVVVREPGGTPLAEDVRTLLLHAPHDIPANAEALLFQVARADLVARVVRPALEGGRVVLADRFDLATRAYQIAGRGLHPAAVEAAIRLATGGLAPDLYLVLDVDPAVGRQRMSAEGKGADRIERADAAFHDRVARAFREAAGPSILHLNADQTPEALHAEVWRALSGRFPRTFPPQVG